MRLLALSVTDTLITIPLSSYYIYLHVFVAPLYPYDWDSTHEGFNRVDTRPAVLWRAYPTATGIELSRWIYVIGAALFFTFFGFSEEARKEYRNIYTRLCRSCGIVQSNNGAPAAPTVTVMLPIHNAHNVHMVTVPEGHIHDIGDDGKLDAKGFSEQGQSLASLEESLVNGSP